jgi:hypothetical protein
MALNSDFLVYKPSHQAAAACLLTFNIYNCPDAAVAIGLASKAEAVVNLASMLSKNALFNPEDPLGSWGAFEEVSMIQASELVEVYKQLIE